MIDGLDRPLLRKRFMLHYNFPPYSVGEVGRFGGSGRREIGHGKLAWRALHPVLPSEGGVPLHDPGPVRHHRVQRLVLDGDGVRRKPGDDGRRRADQAPGRRYRHGPDPRRQGLRGDQRHPRRRGPPRRHGLQGRRHREAGITALQMDIKVAGITEEIMKAALEQAKDGRAHILGEMAKALGGSAASFPSTPRGSRRCRCPRTRSAKSSAPAAR
jgi:polyribonucleotide nucleotidyltransferase